MRYTRRAAKRDTSEAPIVDALRKAGWEVHKELPVDLMCLKRVGDRVMVKLLECKTAKGKKNPKAVLRKEQVEQNEFCVTWNIDKPTTPLEALLAVGEKLEV